MYVKTLKQTREWRFGLEYFYSEIGDVFYVEPTIGFDMLAAGVARRATSEEINAPKDTKPTMEHGQLFGLVHTFAKEID